MPSPEHIRLILIICALIFFLFMFKRPVYGVMSYLMIMMLRPGLFYPQLAAIRIEFTVALVILLFVFCTGKFQYVLVKGNQIIKWMMVFVAIILLSMLQAMDFQTAWDGVLEFLKIVAFFIMIICLVENEEDIYKLLWVFAIVTTFLGYDAISNYFQGNIVESMGGDRIDYAVASQGIGSGHVALANILLQGMPIIWYIGVRTQKKLLKVSGFILFCICIYGVVISGSRGGFLGFIVLLCLFIFFSKRRVVGAVLGLALILIVIPLISSSGYMDLMKSISFDSGADISSSSRISGLRNGIEMMIRRPILGVGPYCYPVARRAWFGWGLWAHNHYGELMGDLGLSGLIVWVGFLYYYLKKAFDYKKVFFMETPQALLLNAIIVATFVRLFLGMGSHSLYAFIWYFLAAIVVVFDRIHYQKLEIVNIDQPKERS